MFPKLTHLIFNYLDSEYPIENGRVKVHLDTHVDFQVFNGNTTTIDVEVSEMFGVPLDVYFWQWTEDRIGEDVIVLFRYEEKPYNLGRAGIITYSNVLKGIQATKIKNAGRWNPIT